MSSTKHYLSIERPIVHQRDSSVDSRSSGGSRDERIYTSGSTEMPYGYDQRRFVERRVPEGDSHIVRDTITTSRKGKEIIIHAQDARRYEPDAPKASEAGKDEYCFTQGRKREHKYYSTGSSR